MKNVLMLCSFFIVLTFASSCTSGFVRPQHDISLELPTEHYDYENTTPENFFVFNDNTPIDNPISNAGATLGRVLFYDGALSFNNSVSCATCHKQELAFSDDKKGSVGFEGLITPRNTPPIMNMRFSNSFFWDMRTVDLETQVLQPVENHLEMGLEDMDMLVQKLSATDYYPPLFMDAFGTKIISKENVSKALAQFIRSMTSFDSKMDKQLVQGAQVFSESEIEGMNLFLSVGCNNCHRVIPFDFFGGGYNGTGDDLANIGLDLDYDDNGMENGRFKVPSLRNIRHTGPYMHDGRFSTIEEVIEHYNSGVQFHENLDARLLVSNQDGSLAPKSLNLTANDKDVLISFLETLEDQSIMTDEKYSDPFIR